LIWKEFAGLRENSFKKAFVVHTRHWRQLFTALYADFFRIRVKGAHHQPARRVGV